jgi:hypothetical protein
MTMRVVFASYMLSAALIATGCNSSSDSGYSMYNEGLFEESPHVVMRTITDSANYALRWKYGSMGFYFHPEASVIDGQLCFSLQGTTSSGAVAGEKAEIAIADRKQIEALERHGAYWLEPNGKRVRLEVRTL